MVLDYIFFEIFNRSVDTSLIVIFLFVARLLIKKIDSQYWMVVYAAVLVKFLAPDIMCSDSSLYSVISTEALYFTPSYILTGKQQQNPIPLLYFIVLLFLTVFSLYSYFVFCESPTN